MSPLDTKRCLRSSCLQAVGVTRRKPGRGAPTLSMSCSDKLARWQCLGLQVGNHLGFWDYQLYIPSQPSV